MDTQAGWPGTCPLLITAAAVSELFSMGKEKANLKSRANHLLTVFLCIISSNLNVTEKEMNCS